MKSSFHQVACSQYNSAAMPIADGSLLTVQMDFISNMVFDDNCSRCKKSFIVNIFSSS